MKHKYLLTIVILFFFVTTKSQQQHSIHEEENRQYSALKFMSESEWDTFQNHSPNSGRVYKAQSKSLNKITYGWYPYWMGTTYYNFDYNLLSDVAYFSYEVNHETGKPKTIHYWLTTNIVNKAHAAGSRIHLCATLFKKHNEFFANQSAVNYFIDSLVSLVEYRNADGVNIDFEMVPASEKDNLTLMMQKLSQKLKTSNPNSQLSIAIPAVDWNNSFDVETMSDFVDLFIIMGYEYHWSGSTYAGPGAPKNNGDIWANIDLTRSVNKYLSDKNVPPGKLVLAIPYYGRDWAVHQQTVPATSAGKGTAKTYKKIRENYSTYNKKWDKHSSVSYYMYNDNSQPHQCWYNDTSSLALIYDMVKMKEIAGIGIWALGYDGEYPELWALLDEKFGNEANIRPQGTFSDMGGPEGNYFNNENYLFKINPPVADTLYLFFEYIDIEKDYDTLFIYDDLGASQNLILEITGNQTLPIVKVPGNKAVLKFVSDNRTTTLGWVMHWNTSGTPPLAVNDIKPNDKICAFPNPFNNQLKIEIESTEAKSALIQLIDANGRIVYQNNKQLNRGCNYIDLKFVSFSLPDGYYVLNVISDKKQISRRAIKICKETRF